MACSNSVARKYPHKITIQAVSESQDATGQPIQTWATHVIRWASIKPLRGREYFNAKQTQSENTVQFWLKYDKTLVAVTTKHRISWKSRIFDIESVINVNEENRKIIIMAREPT